MPQTIVGTEVENFLEYSLEANEHNVETQVPANGINVSWSYIDLLLVDLKKAISSKFQNVSGTAEEKIPHEVHNLSIMCQNHGYEEGIIVLSGFGWSPVKFNYYLNEYPVPSNVRIISYDQFEEEFLTKN